MPDYRLLPVPAFERHPSWVASSLKREGCWVRAQTENDARQKVALATKESLVSDLFTSPWLDRSLTECLEDGAVPAHVTTDAILTANGRTLTMAEIKATAAGGRGTSVEIPNVILVDRKVHAIENLISVKPESTS